jgi:imidazole glycerol-phosphate synthase subunit HisH
MIAVIDYEMGNVGSVLNMLKKVGVAALLTRDHAELRRADGLILPGVGSFDRGMQHLRRCGLVEPLEELVIGRAKPILGICLGMQLMAAGSEEGREAGFGWFDCQVRAFQRDPQRPQLRIPHMGWNLIKPIEPLDPLLENLPPHPRYYFVHSFHFPAGIPFAVAATNHIEPFTSVVARQHIRGCQFHPEKSHSFGLALLRNFSRIALGRPSTPPAMSTP